MSLKVISSDKSDGISRREQGVGTIGISHGDAFLFMK